MPIVRISDAEWGGPEVSVHFIQKVFSGEHEIFYHAQVGSSEGKLINNKPTYKDLCATNFETKVLKGILYAIVSLIKAPSLAITFILIINYQYLLLVYHI